MVRPDRLRYNLNVDRDAQARLIDAATNARRYAYAPYSGFAVGAAIRTRSGAIYGGTNIENAAYPLGQCAEAAALAAMVAAGERQIAAIAIVGSGPEPCPPCGGCRQRLAEFADDAVAVIMVGSGGDSVTSTLGTLLPRPFRLPAQA